MGLQPNEYEYGTARETGAEMQTIRMFDQCVVHLLAIFLPDRAQWWFRSSILREEGNADVFAMRRWATPEPDSSSEEEIEGNMDVDTDSD